ncbi:MAG: thioredoxin domain-containing protein [Patescibacteria group bacterium]
MTEVHLTDSNPSEISNIKSTNRILIIALIIASFFLGSLTNKVSSLEKSAAQTNTSTNQPQGAQPSTITKDTMKDWAKELGLNTSNFNRCLDSDKYKDAVDEDLKAGQTAGVNGTPTFFVNGTILVGAQPFEAFKTIIDKELAKRPFIGQAFAQEIPVSPSLPPKVSVENGHFPALGDKNARVTIVEFSDFECPFCRRYFTDTYPQLKKEYIDTGKVVMYYRHYPLPFHPLAQPFAIASECANEQGKFWEFHDKIFKEQG